MRTLGIPFLDELVDQDDDEKRLVIAMLRTIKVATCTHMQKLAMSSR
jgi:hypothetical protein